jgi:hypothetical protein
MAKFGTFKYGDGTLFGSEGTFPIETMDRVPWIFTDIATGDEYEFAVNPLDADIPDSPSKNITTKYTASGLPINTEGRRAVSEFSFSGTILYEEHFNKMNEWFDKSTQINLSDDLGRKYWIVLTNFSPTRRYKPEYPWMHEYSANAVVLSWN